MGGEEAEEPFRRFRVRDKQRRELRARPASEGGSLTKGNLLLPLNGRSVRNAGGIVRGCTSPGTANIEITLNSQMAFGAVNRGSNPCRGARSLLKSSGLN